VVSNQVSFLRPGTVASSAYARGVFIQHDNLHYVGIAVMMLIAFVYTWTVVYIIAKV
jgi:hypothetical protein